MNVLYLAGLIIVVIVIWSVIKSRRRAEEERPASASAPPSPAGVQNRKAEPPASRKLSVKDLRPGGMVQLTGGVEAGFLEVDYTVEGRNRYVADGDEWFEMKLMDGSGNGLWLEWEEDDELEISVTTSKKELTLSDLGLSKAMLEEFDEEEEGHFVYEERTFVYEESDKARFYRDCAGEGESFYYWDFADKEGDGIIGVERWGSGEYEISIGRRISERDLTIFRAAGDE